MLCLSRLVGQSVVLNGNIKVTVLETRGNKIRLGFEAPKEIPIHRSEVQDAIDHENRAA